jgi:hypothetical protein
MKYFDNNFYPAWIPEQMRMMIDVSELAEPTTEIIEAADFLMQKLGMNIAIYSKTLAEKPNGLCSFFKAAELHSEQLDILHYIEEMLDECVIVAYSNPLQALGK